MSSPNRLPRPGEALYDPAYYDAAYYGQGGRGGFTSYEYREPEQQRQLGFKWHHCRRIPHYSALFVGCARGFEVAYWRERGIAAFGVDVSKWAIEHQIPEAGGECNLYDGRNLPVGDSNVELVACFDVLPHLPEDMREALSADMVRAASRGIVWRQYVKNWRNLGDVIDGQDGAWFRYDRFEVWDERFSKSGKFRLQWLEMHSQYEVTAVYERVP